jgi:DNA-binding Lrp family transcriptional regulator
MNDMGLDTANDIGEVYRPVVDDTDLQLLAALQGGLPLAPRPYDEIGARIGLGGEEVRQRLAKLKQIDVLKRFGVVVRHHELGYGANAMVVWDVPDMRVRSLGRCLAGFDFITLCYRRPRHAAWPYNLYCMIHGKSRDEVLGHLEWLMNHCRLHDVAHEVLFSRRRFKQRGAAYFADTGGSPSPAGRGQG